VSDDENKQAFEKRILHFVAASGCGCQEGSCLAWEYGKFSEVSDGLPVRIE